ncbi:MAG: DUF2652 domain-containing protein [Chloroflexota bacterium]|nr:DUF2652 domain-containing protein [Chloroflexota bacterium]
MRQTQALLVIADISGYTRFMKLHATSLLHAEEIITELLEAVIDGMEYPLMIAKLEGDAVFMYAEVPTGQERPAADSLHVQINRMFTGFYTRSQALVGSRHGCFCEACTHIADLKLKMIVHYGTVAIKQIRGFTEIAGAEVILLHRLLKNSVQSREYVLMTPVAQALIGDYEGLTAERRVEQIDDFGALPVHVYYPKISVDAATVPVISAAAFIERLTAHTRARAFDQQPAPEFHHLQTGKVSRVTIFVETFTVRVMMLLQSLGIRTIKQSL